MSLAIADRPIAPQPKTSGASFVVSWARDAAEANAIRLVYGDRAADIPVTSIKGAVGHCMGASGAIESVVAVMTLVDQVIPPVRNYRNPDPAIGLDIVHGEPRAADIGVIAKHSFGLGGQNACLILTRHADASPD